MIIKGKSVAGASRLAAHLQRTDTNEKLAVLETRGTVAEDLEAALREMEAVAIICPRCTRPFYHASINTRDDEHLTPEQRNHAIDRLEKELGFEGQPRVVVAHVKEGREHFHVVWSRIDHENARTLSDSHNFRKHETVARELEREFGHAHVQGAHTDRDGVERPQRTPTHDAMQQAARTGITPEAARQHVGAIWQGADNGAAFRAGLQETGWTLAKGDRRDFVVLDPHGGAHSLSRITGAKAAEIRVRLSDIDREALPTVAALRAQAREGQEQARKGRPPRMVKPAEARERLVLHKDQAQERAAIAADQARDRAALKALLWATLADHAMRNGKRQHAHTGAKALAQSLKQQRLTMQAAHKAERGALARQHKAEQSAVREKWQQHAIQAKAGRIGAARGGMATQQTAALSLMQLRRRVERGDPITPKELRNLAPAERMQYHLATVVKAQRERDSQRDSLNDARDRNTSHAERLARGLKGAAPTSRRDKDEARIVEALREAMQMTGRAGAGRNR